MYSNQIILDVGAGGTWDAVNVSALLPPTKVGNIYYLFYTGINIVGTMQIGLAHSHDGVGFTKSANNPVIPVGLTYDSGGTRVPTWVYAKGKWWVFYHGTDGAGNMTICYAVGAQPDSLTKKGIIISAPTGYTIGGGSFVSVEFRQRETPYMVAPPASQKSVDEDFIVRYLVTRTAGGAILTMMSQLKLW